MKDTALSAMHVKFGGKMVPFAGYNMPVQFEGINVEHLTVRQGVGVFDVSHMGEFWVLGPNAFQTVQYLTSNDVAVLFDGKVQYSCFPNFDGGIVDDLLVYRFNQEKFLLVVNAANIDKDWAWVNANNKFGAELINASDHTSQLAIQGPLALKAMQKLTETTIEDMEYYTFKELSFAGVDDVLLSTTGYTGSGGCEIYFKHADAVKIYEAVLEAGADFEIKPIGLGARDTLRLESGFCLYGNDINDSTSPIEAGLGWITKFVQGNDFINREYHENIKNNGPKKMLKGFKLLEKGVPRHDYEVCDKDGQPIGHVTSGTMSPMLHVGIGMAYVNSDFAKMGTEIFIKIREKLVKAQIVKMPFFK
ncbi:MAG: glycine cleavage system aminomethyltransferase GcvT [Bacteroidales bacterium]|nr:glycine cleavage system aminomethyltransferase GcvT [Bacteroidales bacterium]